MLWLRIVLVGLAAFAGACFSSVAIAETPDLKLGLWETVRMTSHSGNPAVDLSRIPPEQRARAAVLARKSRAEKPKTRVTRSCLTQAKLERDFFPEKDPAASNCTRTIITDTKSERDVKIACTGKNGGSGDMHFEIVSPEEVKGKYSLTMPARDGGEDYTITSEFSSKWLRESCGKKVR